MTNIFPKWLSYHPWRNTMWTEHDTFPEKVVKFWEGRSVPPKIYEVSDNGQMTIVYPKEIATIDS